MTTTMTKPKSPSSADAKLTVRPGYKRSDVGVIPAEWGVVRLVQISAFITKGSTPTTYGFKWQASGVRFLRSECVSDEGLDLAQATYISPATHEALRRSAVRDGDILITITGNVGRVILLTGVDDANINQHIARIRIATPGVVAGFVYQFLSQPGVRRAFNSITTGQAYPQISLRQVRDARLALPPEPEQRAIAEVLSDVDGLLRALETLIAKKRAIKQAAMQQLLTGKIRLPEFSGEWETRRLGEVMTCLPTANNPRADLADDGDAEYIHYGDVHAHPVPILDCRRVSLPRIRKSRVGNAVDLQDGDLVMVDASEDLFGVGKSIEVRGLAGRTVVAGLHTILCRGHAARWAMGFKAYLQFNPIFKSALTRLATGISVYAVSNRQLVDVAVPLPSVSEQEAIVAVLSDMDAEVATLERRRDKARAIKQGMMQQLLTGRVRLVRSDQAAVNV